jgi:hypothetical protein
MVQRMAQRHVILEEAALAASAGLPHDAPVARTLHADDGTGNPLCGSWRGSLTHLATKWSSLAPAEGCPACADLIRD